MDYDNMPDDDEVETVFDTGPDNANLKVLPPYIFLVLFLAGVVLEMIWGGNFLRWQAQIILGCFCGGVGFILFGMAIKSLMDVGTALSPDEPTTALVTSGPYKFSRNPVYLSYFLMYLGGAFLFDIIWSMLLFVPLCFLVLKYVIEPEETYLERKFGRNYNEYKNRVRRWI